MADKEEECPEFSPKLAAPAPAPPYLEMGATTPKNPRKKKKFWEAPICIFSSWAHLPIHPSRPPLPLTVLWRIKMGIKNSEMREFPSRAHALMPTEIFLLFSSFSSSFAALPS